MQFEQDWKANYNYSQIQILSGICIVKNVQKKASESAEEEGLVNRSKEMTQIIAGGLVIGVIASLLVFFGNPSNMGFCIACFLRDTAGALGLHQAAPVQYIRPEIIGIVLGSTLLALAGVHLAFAFPFVQKIVRLFGVFNTRLLILTSIICFLAFALFYVFVYRRTAKAYYSIVSDTTPRQ